MYSMLMTVAVLATTLIMHANDTTAISTAPDGAILDVTPQVVPPLPNCDRPLAKRSSREVLDQQLNDDVDRTTPEYRNVHTACRDAANAIVDQVVDDIVYGTAANVMKVKRRPPSSTLTSLVNGLNDTTNSPEHRAELLRATHAYINAQAQ